MYNDIERIIKTLTAEQLKEMVEKNQFINKDLKDFNKGKESIDKLVELNKEGIHPNVQNALIFYFAYRLKEETNRLH